jgi:hypothetical protein
MSLIQNGFIDFTIENTISKLLQSISPEETYWMGKNWKDTIALRRDNPLIDFTNQEEINRVLSWGGIHRFKQFSSVQPAINDLENNIIAPKTLTAISSYSKLFSFYKPNEYFIFDARVAFSLNCLLIMFYNSNNGQKIEKNLIQFNFTGRSRNKFIKEKSALFRDYEKFETIPYLEYNTLIKNLYSHSFRKVIFENNEFEELKKPEIIEMLLFKNYKEIFEIMQKLI